jgi:hypothetical protein
VSSLVGSPNDRLSLARGVDLLGEAARRAGRPGLVWLAGLYYPSLNLTVDLLSSVTGMVGEMSDVTLPRAGSAGAIVTLFAPRSPLSIEWNQPVGLVGGTLLLVPAFLLLYRLVVGLARVSDEQSSSETRPGLRTAWVAGKGLGGAGLGVWLLLLGLLLGAMLVLLGPLIVLLRTLGITAKGLVTGILTPVLLLILAYAAVLMVVNQLALHSLAHNRRGAASALTHAWRLIQGDPLSALRATLVDFVLFVSVALLAGFLERLLPGGLGALAAVGLYGFAGVTRAGYWARVYRALGGLSHTDGVPGL